MASVTKTARVVCPRDCPDRCAMLADVVDGRLVAVRGNPAHPTTRGFLCVKMDRSVERVYSPLRVRYPRRRVGPKGSGQFRRISWDEALDVIADRFRQIVATDGPEAILPFSYAGTMSLLMYQGMDRRFFNRLGAARLARTICATAGSEGYRYTTGANWGTDPEAAVDAKLIVAWGINIMSCNVHMYPLIREAQRKGATFVVIDPHRNRTAARADWYLQPRPGTDAALALGLMHVIVAEERHDRRYVAEHTVGFDELCERLAEYPPDRVAKVTGLSEEDVVRLARLYAERQPALIRCGQGMQRHSNGGMMIRTISCLPALVGAWAKPGGGFIFGNSGAFPINADALQRPDLLQGDPRTINMNRLGEALLEARPPVKALFVYNSNPANVVPNQRRVLAGLSREDLFTVVLDPLMTDTALYADVVLPATTEFEHLDVDISYWHYYVQLSEPAISPVGESKSNFEVFALLARRMGFAEDCFRERPEQAISGVLDVDHPYLAGIDLETLRREGWQRLNTPTRPFSPFLDGRFPTPSGKLELYSARLAAEGRDPLPAHVPLVESREATPALAARYPLNLITPGAHHFLNSTFCEVDALRAKEGAPTIELHPVDAAARGLGNGDWARVFNARGECYMRVAVGNTVPEGVACSVSVWWNRFSPLGGNCNQLTSDALTDFGAGPIFHTNLVQVERLADGWDYDEAVGSNAETLGTSGHSR